MKSYLSELRNRHLAEWRFLLFTIIVTVKSLIWNVIRIVSPPFGDVTNRLPFVQRLTAFYQVLHILSRKSLCYMRAPLCCMKASCPQQTENEDRVLTHAVTHEQKNRGGNNGEKRICG